MCRRHYFRDMMRKLIILIAWCGLGSIAFVTLSPIGLRPELGSAGFERFAAYGALGVLFVVAYPRRFTLMMIFILGVAVSLELLQHLTPDRHGHIADAAQKVIGGLVGSSAAKFAHLWRDRS
ncbi:VanZ family protein [Bradyrhizobium sp. WSM471]|uniref:VanZ family protein n=2 Tax=Bradyrhizobium sp. WSM471 TaxID=319017 RepID=UPI001E62541C|nr:VanZ family protein [Bradyrhizobium canariense]UFW43434.1 VanZ family protein [Bradyrhizobium canariense]